MTVFLTFLQIVGMMFEMNLSTELELGYTLIICIILVNNNSAKKLAKNLEFHKRSKYIKIIYHFSRQAILEGKANITQIPSKYILADFLTKTVSRSELHPRTLDRSGDEAF